MRLLCEGVPGGPRVFSQSLCLPARSAGVFEIAPSAISKAAEPQQTCWLRRSRAVPLWPIMGGTPVAARGGVIDPLVQFVLKCPHCQATYPLHAPLQNGVRLRCARCRKAYVAAEVPDPNSPAPEVRPRSGGRSPFQVVGTPLGAWQRSREKVRRKLRHLSDAFAVPKTKAAASVALGVLGLFFSALTAVPAVALGILALRSVSRRKERTPEGESVRRVAKAGIALAIGCGL